MLTAHSAAKDLKKLGTPARAKTAAWYFKTGKGHYGYGDIFLGVTVPEQRKLAKRYRDLPLGEISTLIKSPLHECRLTALFILVGQFECAAAEGKARVARFYLQRRKCVNNWDLVDSSAPRILGRHLSDKNRTILYKLARSKNLWERRIAIIATLAFIKENEYTDTLAIAKLLLNDRHDLIHKAVGWMLREVGKKKLSAEEAFLKKYAAVMPRTMLRYAIEKFPEKKRRAFLAMRPKIEKY